MTDDVTDASRLRTRLSDLGLSQRGLARAMGINERTVRDYVSGAIDPVPTHVWRWLDSAIAPPPAGTTDADDRDEACAEAMAPHVACLVERSRSAGWHEAEALTALMADVATRIRAGGGDDELRAILKSLILQT